MKHLRLIQSQFDRQAEAYESLPDVQDEKGLNAIVALANLSRTESVLDLACGPGFLTVAFARNCKRAVGLDATPKLLAHGYSNAARVGVHNVCFVLGDAEMLPFAAGAFDVAVCRAAFHHFRDPHAVLGQIIQVLKRKGRLIVGDQVNAEHPRRASYHDRLEKLCDPTHVHALSESEFLRMFATAGLRLASKLGGELKYSLEEFISHGGPPPAVAQEIEDMALKAINDPDLTDLRFYRELGELFMVHNIARFVLEKD